jgi:AcrR family transcriptional regulator
MTTTERRKYDSPLRRKRAAETRDRIVAAGSQLVHEFTRWDWRELTIRAVAKRAGVSEQTVYRHFSNERSLHDAVMRRLRQEAGVPLDEQELKDLPTVIARMYDYMPSYAVAPRSPKDPTIAAKDEERRHELLTAVERATEGWSKKEQEMAAALLDVLWSVPAYDRLVAVWGLETKDAGRAMSALVRVLVDVILDGRPPWSER